jgi:hypothetical protein
MFTPIVFDNNMSLQRFLNDVSLLFPPNRRELLSATIHGLMMKHSSMNNSVEVFEDDDVFAPVQVMALPSSTKAPVKALASTFARDAAPVAPVTPVTPVANQDAGDKPAKKKREYRITAYNVFFDDHKTTFKEQNPNASAVQISSYINGLWKTISVEDMDRYSALAQAKNDAGERQRKRRATDRDAEHTN